MSHLSALSLFPLHPVILSSSPASIFQSFICSPPVAPPPLSDHIMHRHILINLWPPDLIALSQSLPILILSGETRAKERAKRGDISAERWRVVTNL
jgi:hypothetical protein